MIPIAWLLLFTALNSTDLVDDVYRIPPGDWRYVDLDPLKQEAAGIRASFSVESGPRDVRVALLRRADLERLRDGEPYGIVAATPYGASGDLRYAVQQPGEYVIVIYSSPEASQAAAVHVQVALDFGKKPPGVTQISAARQLTVIAVSFVVFFGIVTYSGRRLLRAVKR